ncbi:MAG: hypothetical protein ABSH50_26125 [Bryobacteraceae bacterium]|jgi:hypothetical protein
MAAAAGAAGAAAIANAIKASGVLVKLEPPEFSKVLGRIANPLVVVAQGGVFRTSYQYLVSYKGLAFYTRSPEAVALPADAEVVSAVGISIPG